MNCEKRTRLILYIMPSGEKNRDLHSLKYPEKIGRFAGVNSETDETCGGNGRIVIIFAAPHDAYRAQERDGMFFADINNLKTRTVSKKRI